MPAAADAHGCDLTLGKQHGGDAIRRLLPVAIAGPIVLGGLRYLGQKADLFPLEIGVIVMVVGMIGLSVGLLLWSAQKVDEIDAERERAARENAANAPALAARAEELELANAELAATTARLERSNEELQQFATVASHDLREPLRVVSGFADLLARRHGEDLGENGQRFVEAITGGVKRMDEMISDLLAYARAGRLDSPLEPVDANEVVSDVLAGLGRAIEESGAQVEVDELPMVMGNPASLRQLFQNLIANAIKFVEDGPPRIRVWAAEVPEGWRFTVRDNGIGIDPERADQIFGMFKRLHGADRYPGTGVGLAVCQRIVDVHGGRIWVEPAPGGGSQFMFTIARAIRDGDAEPPPEQRG